MRPLTILLALVLIVLAIALVYPRTAQAKPIAVGQDGPITVTLTDEPCALPAVSNLPFRATWKEGDQFYEGCFGGRAGIVVMYFDDKSVVILSIQAFIKVRGA